MPSYHLAPSLDALRDEINRRWPGRSKASDGWIGDASHQASKSDHNPDWDAGGVVRAIDVTSKDIDADVVIRALVKDSRVNYVIHRGQIYSRVRDFRPKRYTGANPHNHHVHVSIVHTRTGASSTARWLPSTVAPTAPTPVAPTAPTAPDKDGFDMADLKDLEKVVNASNEAHVSRIVREVWGYVLGTDPLAADRQVAAGPALLGVRRDAADARMYGRSGIVEGRTAAQNGVAVARGILDDLATMPADVSAAVRAELARALGGAA